MESNELRILAVIPARGGSKGISRKNIRMLVNKPLIAHTIETALQVAVIDRVVVSTDSQEIADVARQFGAEVPFLRPAELARSESKVIDAIIHLLDELEKKEQYVPTHILLLQPTSPLREAEDIERALAFFFTHEADSLVSICRTENVLMTKGEDHVINFENPEMLSTPNRQELPTYYKFDGSMLYLVKTDALRRERSFFPGKLIGFEIERWKAADLDEPQDFIVGEILFKHKESIKDALRTFSQDL